MSSVDLEARIAKAAQLAAPIYQAHGWTWVDAAGTTRAVPDAARIALTIRRLYDVACKNGQGSASSGRLSVWIDEDDGEISVDVHLSVLVDAAS